MRDDNDITYFGRVNYRSNQQKFGIKDADRLMHIYLTGKSGSGKSTLLLNMAISDLRKGHGFAVLDPHSQLAEQLLRHVPASRAKDVIYFNPRKPEGCVPFNPLAGVPQKYHHLVASGIISTFKKIWWESWGPRMEHILRYSLLTLLQYPGATLLDIQPLLTNENLRNQIVSCIEDERIRRFWADEFAGYTKALRAEAIAPVLNKVGLLSASQSLRMIFGQKERGLRFGDIMNNRKVFIANLSKGELGEETSAFLGAMIVTSIQLAAYFRTSLNTQKLVPFFLYIDEFQSFVTLSFCDILAESRKMGLGLFLTNQHLSQIDPKVLSAILGNVGTLITFRIGSEDANILEKEFSPEFAAEDLIHQHRFHMYLKLMIDGATSRPFSATSLPPFSLV